MLMASLCLLAYASVFEIGPIANIYFVRISLGLKSARDLCLGTRAGVGAR